MLCETDLIHIIVLLLHDALLCEDYLSSMGGELNMMELCWLRNTELLEGRGPFLVTLFPPEIPHGLAWVRTWRIIEKIYRVLCSEEVRFVSRRYSGWRHVVQGTPTVTCALLFHTRSVSSPRIGVGTFRSSFDIRSRSCSNRKLCEAVSSPDVFPVSALLVQFAYFWRHSTKLRWLTIQKSPLLTIQ